MTIHHCPRSTKDFPIAIVCASRQEVTAIKALFDEDYGIVRNIPGKQPSDPNSYIAGRIGKNSLIVTQIPQYGKVFAAKTAFWLSKSFPQIRLCLVVSTGAGIPCTRDGQKIRLGDVLVSDGLIQWDFGKLLPGGVFLRKTGPKYDLPPTAHRVASLVHKLRCKRQSTITREKMAQHLNYLQKTFGSLEASNYLSAEENRLFPQWSPPGHSASDGVSWANIPAIEHFKPNVHFGCLASGDAVMRSAEWRDKTAAKEGVLGFEWAGVGVWSQLPTMVITGVGDYGDGYATDPWPAYASASAASCAKAILQAYHAL
jgi:nucleoside phosphorylase